MFLSRLAFQKEGDGEKVLPVEVFLVGQDTAVLLPLRHQEVFHQRNINQGRIAGSIGNMQPHGIVFQQAREGQFGYHVRNSLCAAGILAVRPIRLQVRVVHQGAAVKQCIVVSQPSVTMQA